MSVPNTGPFQKWREMKEAFWPFRPDSHNYIGMTSALEARCWWRSWLRHCAISRKVAGSIPDGVI